MHRFHIRSAIMAAVIIIGGTGGAFATGGENENGHEAAAVLGAKTSLAQAVAAAEQHTGGRAARVGVEEDEGAYVYQVRTVTTDNVTDVFIDPASAKVLRADDEGFFDSIFDWDHDEDLNALMASPTTLAMAITAAEQKVGGNAIEARLEDEDDALRFKVEVIKDATVHQVLVDGATGTVLTVSAAEDDDHDED
jgi:uncharacterized membrane protein YkoI